MRPFSIPQLPDDFEQLGACVIVDAPEVAILDWARANASDDLVVEFEADGEERWLELNIAVWDEKRVHFHLELSRVEFEHGDPKQYDFDRAVAVCTELIALNANRDVTVRSRARLVVEKKSLPRKSMISKLLAFSNKSCGASFSLNGATLPIKDEMFSRLTFNQPDDEKKVYVELFAFTETPLDGEYFDRMSDLMKIGVDCFVYEQLSRDASNG